MDWLRPPPPHSSLHEAWRAERLGGHVRKLRSAFDCAKTAFGHGHRLRCAKLAREMKSISSSSGGLLVSPRRRERQQFAGHGVMPPNHVDPRRANCCINVIALSGTSILRTGAPSMLSEASRRIAQDRRNLNTIFERAFGGENHGLVFFNAFDDLDLLVVHQADFDGL